MVLYKRKPIVLPDPKPLPQDLNIPVWHIDETGEWFPTYEEFLDRMDFYTRHHFTCEITGASCLTFFEALESEETQFKHVEEKFPLKLREPVARFLHFNRIRRLDNLVEKVYAMFKNDYFPGETVFLRRKKEGTPSSSNTGAPSTDVSAQNSPQPGVDRSSGGTPGPDSTAGGILQHQKAYIIKEKIQFNPTYDPETKEILVPGHVKYMLIEDDSKSNSQTRGVSHSPSSHHSIVTDQSQIYRDRSTFTKHLIKCFFKITLQRASSKMGAPWCLKPEYVKMYGLTMDWPDDLLQYKDDEPQASEDGKGRHSQQESSGGRRQRSRMSQAVKLEDSVGPQVGDGGSVSVSASAEATAAATATATPSGGATDAANGDSFIKMEDESTERATKIHRSRKRKNTTDINSEKSGKAQGPVDDEAKVTNKQQQQTKKRKVTQSTEPSELPALKTPATAASVEFNEKEADTPDGGTQVSTPAAPTPVAVPTVNVTTITDDLELPYQKPPEVYLRNLHYYNKDLEYLPAIPESGKNDINLREPCQFMDKLLQIYQFINTFNEKLFISNFNLDQFITSIKCTDPDEMRREYVQIYHPEDFDDTMDAEREDETKVKEEDSNGKGDADNDSNNVSNNDDSTTFSYTKFQSQGFQSLIDFKNAEYKGKLVYEIVKDTDRSVDDIVDDTKRNGTNLFVEAFVCLLPLFIDEQGNWTALIVDEWITEDKMDEEEDGEEEEEDMTKNENDTGVDDNLSPLKKEASKDEAEPEDVDMVGQRKSNEELEFELTLEKCLNYKNIYWAERLAKRQFSNNYWLIILIGIFQDSLVIPRYKEFIESFTSKVVPRQISATQLPRQLWRNFCNNLTMYEKITALWILVEMSSNFSPDIKSAVDEATDLSAQIRSERFKISKDLKAEVQALTNVKQEEKPEEYKEQVSRVEVYQHVKKFLDKQVVTNNFQRLKPLGMDRYGNRYFWLDLSGTSAPKVSPSESKTGGFEQDGSSSVYHSGRLWIQGPSTSMAECYLRITADQISSWKLLAKTKGPAVATKEVFQMYRSDDGLYFAFNEEDSEYRVVVNEEGLVDPFIQLTPIQRKIIDETPECLLLDDKMWYSLDNFEELNKILDWFNVWGRREHDLLRQFKPIIDDLQLSFIARGASLDMFVADEDEKKLFEKLEEHDLTPSELNTYRSLNGSESADGLTDIGGVSGTKRQLENIENQLEEIADRILSLDDAPKTTETTEEIRSCEKKRDMLLQQREDLINSQRPGTRVMARTERKRLITSRNNKIASQEKILTELLNHKRSKRIQEVTSWKNEVALEVWGSELRKASSMKNKPVGSISSAEDKMKDILNHIATELGDIASTYHTKNKEV